MGTVPVAYVHRLRMAGRLLRDQNDARREAVLHGEGQTLVLTGAESGKARLNIHRTAGDPDCRVRQ